MQTRTVRVEQIVEVSIDDTKFTPEFMAEFRRTMYPFDSVAVRRYLADRRIRACVKADEE